MTQPKAQTILPWSNSDLEALLLGIISHGSETSKVDFKTEIELSTQEQKSELLKDISAIANTYDDQLEDHGFLVFGVKDKVITGISKTESNNDNFQNTIEQLLKSYIAPMPQVYVISFVDAATGHKWGAVVIPPRHNKPHMFFKDFQCTIPKHSRKKGEWFVRHGSTTDPGLPEDLLLITQKQTELLLKPLQESIRNLQLRVAKTEEQYNSALFKLVERALPPQELVVKKEEVPSEITEKTPEVVRGTNIEASKALGVDLPTRLKQKLRTPKDALGEDLLAEARNIRGLIDAEKSEIPWAPQLNNSAVNKQIIEALDAKVKAFQISVATIALNDSQGIYTETLIRALRVLAKMVEVPNSVTYNGIGKALRYYPLGLVLYTIFVCGVAANRGTLLKEVLDIPLKRQGYNVTTCITDLFYFWYDAKAFFNDAYGQRSCEPIMQRIRQIISDNVGEMMPEFSEPEFYFPGEFVLALANIDKDIAAGETAERRVPLPGLYLYMHDARGPIEGLLLTHPDWLDQLYSAPLNEILDAFDQNASKMETSGCIALGLHGFKARDTYDQSLKKKLKK